MEVRDSKTISGERRAEKNLGKLIAWRPEAELALRSIHFFLEDANPAVRFDAIKILNRILSNRLGSLLRRSRLGEPVNTP